MSLNNLLEQANSHVVEVNKLMGDVEKVENIINAIKEPNQVISFTQRGVGTTYIDDTLTEEELRSLKEMVMVCIMRNRDDKVAKLEKLLGIRKQSIVNPDFEAAVQEMVSESEIKSEYKAYYDEERLRQAIAEGKSVKQIAEDFGCQPCNVYDGMRKFGIETKQKHNSRVEKKQENPKMEYPELTVDEARRVYTEGDLSLTGAATYFGVKKSVFHEFVTSNNIFKPVEKPDPYFEMNRMSKDDFKKHMMKGR